MKPELPFSYFRLYVDNKTEFNSTLFDLISGDKETKQTKGLAYILYQYNDFLFNFIQFPPISEKITYELKEHLNISKITHIEVSAERITTDKNRADIVIKIDLDSKPTLAILIEAKSIKANVNQQLLNEQLKKYLSEEQFPEFMAYKKIGVVLTKYRQTIPEVVNISWEDVIQLLFNYCKKQSSNEIISQYLKFITEVDKNMKYYEKEVLSIPAGKSLLFVEKYNIYSCPDTETYNYKKAIFVGFRKSGGGEMEKLYKIEDVFIMNPNNDSEMKIFQNSTYSEEIKNKINRYIESTKVEEFFESIDTNYRFYILSDKAIELPNKPRHERNNAKFTYYSIAEVLSNKTIIPESKKIISKRTIYETKTTY
jgi:hypothetical protein